MGRVRLGPLMGWRGVNWEGMRGDEYLHSIVWDGLGGVWMHGGVKS